MVETQVEVLGKIKRFIEKINNQGMLVKQAFLYGSYATGKADAESDIDVALISAGFSEDFVDNYVKLAAIRSEIDRRIEPKAFRPEEFVDEHPLVWEIKQHGIPLIQ
jgi:predicted nucleotidyltransferase